jgi:hypothetical protein
MKTVIEMAQQTLNRDKLGFWAANVGDLEAFAELVRADEREACAKVCESEWSNVAERMYGEECAAAIRAKVSNT